MDVCLAYRVFLPAVTTWTRRKECLTIPTGARSVAFSPDGKHIATAGYDAAGVWDAILPAT